MTSNSEQVKKTLKLLLGILNSNGIEYRLFGSIIPAALNGSLHRKINDFDFFIDYSKKDIFIKSLQKLEFRKKQKNICRISERLNLFVFEHDQLLETTFFAINFCDKTAVLDAKPFRFVVQNRAIATTHYNLLGLKFIGIPSDTAYTGALLAEHNPKRVEEFKIFETHGIHPRRNDYLDVYLGFIKVNWSLDLLNASLNLLGRIRVKMGKTYDFWR